MLIPGGWVSIWGELTYCLLAQNTPAVQARTIQRPSKLSNTHTPSFTDSRDSLISAQDRRSFHARKYHFRLGKIHPLEILPINSRGQFETSVATSLFRWLNTNFICCSLGFIQTNWFGIFLIDYRTNDKTGSVEETRTIFGKCSEK